MNKEKLILIFYLAFTLILTIYSQKVMINEFMASNHTVYADIDFRKYYDWIELYNDDTVNIDLNGFFITDNEDEPEKWQFSESVIIEKKSYLLLYADDKNIVKGESYKLIFDSLFSNSITIKGYHLNFKLDREGEQIILYNSNLQLIDSVSFPAQPTDVSFGRMVEDEKNWRFYGNPTPGKINSFDGATEVKYSNVPRFLYQDNEIINSGFFSGTQTIILSSRNGEVYYTVNGSTPDKSSFLYTEPIIVDSTTVIRARVFENNKLPSKVITKTFFIDEQTTFPVFSIATDSINLWSEERGIYIEGPDFNDYRQTANYFQDWKRPANIEFFESDHSLGFELMADISIIGRWNSTLLHKSLAISTDADYEIDQINCKIFNNKSIGNYKDLILRVCDLGTTVFRDGMMQYLLVNQMDIDYQEYRPAIVFINGEYFGIQNIREKQNEDYLYANHNVDPNNIDLLENNSVFTIIEGDSSNYNSLINFIANNSLNQSKNYNYIKTQIDINEYINYNIAEIYFSNFDWPASNNKYWRPKTEKGKWRWMIFDVEAGFHRDDIYGEMGTASYDMLNHATSLVNIYHNSEWSTFLFRKLLENETFRNEFIQRFCIHLNTTFKPERVISIIDSFQRIHEPEIHRYLEKWNNNTYGEWIESIERMRDFAVQRPAYMRRHLANKFDLTDTANINFFVSSPKCGKIYINNVLVTDSFNNVMLFDSIPFNLKAVPEIGYKFKNWEGISNNDSSVVLFSHKTDTTITAVFEPLDINTIPNIIKNDLILNQQESPFYALGDIIILPEITLEINEGIEIYMPENASIYSYGELIINGSVENPVKISPNENNNAINQLYINRDTNKQINWGAICFNNSTGTGHILNLQITGASMGNNTSIYKGAISAYKSNVILDNVTINCNNQPFYSQYNNIYIKNCEFYSPAICDYINIKFANYAVTEKCIFYGNKAADTDAIDYDGVENGSIKNNIISDFAGENSDGIDIGENTIDVIIDSNIIFNITDKGISIGQQSSTTIKHNIIYNCNEGVAVKDSLSFALIDHNTFYNNNYCVASFEKKLFNGGGNAIVTNSILANSKIYSYRLDKFSLLEFQYNLSNTDELTGTGNIYNVPLFSNTATSDFNLISLSPCIDKGNPNFRDPDGTYTDIGAFYFHQKQDTVFFKIDLCEGDEFMGYSSPGVYYETYTGSNGADSIIELTINFSEFECINSLYNETFKNDLIFYPNPVYDKGIIKFNCFENQNIAIQIFDYLGRLKYYKNIKFPYLENKVVINFIEFNTGIYFLKIESSNSNINYYDKIIVK